MSPTWTCTCMVCVPPDPADMDAIDRRAVADVKRYGWHIILIPPGEEPGEPAFAYSIGMMHSLGHPEILMSGQPSTLLGGWINEIGEQITAGYPLVVGKVREGVVEGFAVTAEPVTAVARDDAVGILRPFYRRDDVPALQCVWASPAGHFPWQAGAPTELELRQPPSWRTPCERSGALAVRPDWPFPVPGDYEVLTTWQVIEEHAPILVVTRVPAQGGDDWLFSTHERAALADLRQIHLVHLVTLRPTLRDLADLPPGWRAVRATPLDPWQRSLFAEDSDN